MIEMLETIRENLDPRQNPYESEAAVSIWREKLATTTEQTPPGEKMETTFRYAYSLLQAGRSEDAFVQFQDYERQLHNSSEAPDRRTIASLWKAQAICMMRIGEQENCIHNHNADSCLLPIQGGGVHELGRGSRGAIRILARLLGEYPGDLRARWLLNVAYMTLGEYPDSVPGKFLIDPQVFESEFDVGRFPDVAGVLGLDVDDLAGGVVMEDFDQDGFLDIMASGWGFESQLRVFRNNGDGSFTEKTDAAGLTGLVGGLNLIHGDYDNNGYMDVLVLRGAWLGPGGRHPNSLLRNEGNFTFSDVTEESGFLSHRPTQTATWLDYNGDGWLDIFVGNESGRDDVHPCELFRNNGDGTFTECAEVHGLDLVGFVKGVTSGDYNNDGRPDLFLSTWDGSHMLLLRNDGPDTYDRSPNAPWRFSDVTLEAGLDQAHRAFPCWFWDYDNNGFLDLLVPGYSIQDVGDIAADYLGLPHAGSRTRLFRNNGDGTFTDVSRESGVLKLSHTMGANFGDLDNDGWLDFYLGTGDPDFATIVPNRMFRNDDGRRFQDVTTSGGFGQIQKGHGIAFGDLDNDGDQDVYSVVGGAVTADNYRNQLFVNPGHDNHWVKLILEGVTSNRPAIGARIKVTVPTPKGSRAIYRTVGSGGSFGASSFRQEIGLGQARYIERIEVFWPATGNTQVMTNLSVDQCYRIREGRPAPVLVELGRFKLPASSYQPGGHRHDHHEHSVRNQEIPLDQKSAGLVPELEWCGQTDES